MQRRHRRAHLRAWSILAIVLPAMVIGSVLIRKRLPIEAPAIQLSKPGTPPAKSGS